MKFNLINHMSPKILMLGIFAFVWASCPNDHEREITQEGREESEEEHADDAGLDR